MTMPFTPVCDLWHITSSIFEILGPLNASALNFLSDVGRRLSSLSGDPGETAFLFQRLSMIVQRFNSVLFVYSNCSTDKDPDLYSHQ